MPRSTRSLRNLLLVALSGAFLAAGCGGDQPATAPPADTGKMEPSAGKMEPSPGKMEPGAGKMEPDSGKMEPSTGKMDKMEPK